MRKYYYLKEKEEAQKEQHPEIQVESWNVNEPILIGWRVQEIAAFNFFLSFSFVLRWFQMYNTKKSDHLEGTKQQQQPENKTQRNATQKIAKPIL